MNWEKITEIFSAEKKFRLKQMKQALFVDLVDDWNKVTVFPLELREHLNAVAPLLISGQYFSSKKSESSKVLITLADGNKIESVLMRHAGGRNTVCVSTQVGCPLGCTFCATGKLGFKRNLTVGEILDQVIFFSRHLRAENEKVNNIVFMGMGEPFLNYDNVLQAIRIMNDQHGLSIGARHISISTAGIIPGIHKLITEDLPVNLALSLHAADDDLRKKLMPVACQYSLADVFSATDEFIEKTNRKVMLEYLMIRGVNDRLRDADNLIKLLAGRRLYMVNLIRYNQTGIYRASDMSTVKKFQDYLHNHGVHVTTRYRFGTDIDAACGQLAAGNTAEVVVKC